MLIRVRGAKDRKFTSLIKLATKNYAQRLFNRQMLPYLTVFIQITDKLGASGFCWAEEPWKPREFIIELNRQNKLSMITTLAHEMVHAKQFAYQEMRDVFRKSRMTTVWHGTDHTNTGYWDRPWEIEAYGLENSLVAKFLQDTNSFRYFKTNYEQWFSDDYTQSGHTPST